MTMMVLLMAALLTLFLGLVGSAFHSEWRNASQRLRQAEMEWSHDASGPTTLQPEGDAEYSGSAAVDREREALDRVL